MTLLGHVHNGQIIFESPIVLPEGAQVRVEVVNDEASLPTSNGPQSLSQKFMKYAGRAKGLPADFARNHDHYIHGTPRE